MGYFFLLLSIEIFEPSTTVLLLLIDGEDIKINEVVVDEEGEDWDVDDDDDSETDVDWVVVEFLVWFDDGFLDT